MRASPGLPPRGHPASAYAKILTISSTNFELRWDSPFYETLEWSSRTLSKGHSLLILTAGIIRRMIVVYTSCGKRVGWEKFSHESFSQQRCDVQQNATNKQPPQVTPMSRRFRVHSHHVHNKFNLGSKLDSESVQSGPRVSVRCWRRTVLKLFGPRREKAAGSFT